MNVLFPHIDLLPLAEASIRWDNEHNFTYLLWSQLGREKDAGHPLGSTFSMKELLRLICVHRAEKCANGLLSGEATIFVDNVNLPVEEGGLPPLHLAAQNLSYGVCKAFLMAGSDPNLRCDDDDEKLPLSLALEALSCNRCVTDWSVEKSVPKLIYIFCLKELREPLATIRLLASRTEHLEKLCLQYAEKGEVVKLAAVLFVAWNKLVAPYDGHHQKNVECCPIAQCIQKEFQALSSDQELAAQCSSKLVKLESAWKMLKLLEEKVHDIRIHCRYDLGILDNHANIIPVVENHEVPYNLARRLRVGGPEDVCCDDIECLMPRLKPKQKAWLNRSLQIHSRKPTVFTTTGKKGFAAMVSQSLNPNLTKDHGGQRTLTTKVENPSICRFLPKARTCAHLFSIAKRSFK